MACGTADDYLFIIIDTLIFPLRCLISFISLIIVIDDCRHRRRKDANWLPPMFSLLMAAFSNIAGR